MAQLHVTRVKREFREIVTSEEVGRSGEENYRCCRVGCWSWGRLKLWFGPCAGGVVSLHVVLQKEASKGHQL